MILFDAFVRSSYHWAREFAVNKRIITEETSHLYSHFFLECDENKCQVTGKTLLSFSFPIQHTAETTQASRHCNIERNSNPRPQASCPGVARRTVD